MTTCQIAFGFKNRVVCIQDFSLDTPNVFQKMKASASQYTGGDATDIVLETMSAGTHVTIRSDQDAAKYIFGCAVDGRAKIKVKIARKPKREHSKELESKSDSVMDLPASNLVNQSFIRKMIELLDQWAEVEVSYEEAYALVEALKTAVLEREPLESLIDELVHALGMEELNLTNMTGELNWNTSTGLRLPNIKDRPRGSVSNVLFNRYDSWISMASQEELLYVAEQVPTVLDKLVSRRGKLFEDVFIKQKPLKKILKIRLPKSKIRREKADQKEVPRTQHMRKGETNAFEDFEDFEEVQPGRQPSPKRKETRVPIKVKKEAFEVEDTTQKRQVSRVRRMEKPESKAGPEFEEFEVVKAVKKESKRAKDSDESSSEEEQEIEKKGKRDARLAKRMERAGCKTAEELGALKAANKELKHAQVLQKYGCLTKEELKQARKEERLAKQLARTGCQDEEELNKHKLAKKLERAGCKTVEELNELKKQKKFSKSKRDF